MPIGSGSGSACYGSDWVFSALPDSRRFGFDVSLAGVATISLPRRGILSGELDGCRTPDMHHRGAFGALAIQHISAGGSNG